MLSPDIATMVTKPEEETKKGHCCICGMIKNCARYLPRVLANMEKFGALFTDYRIILVYDLSTDNSLQILKDYARTHSDRVLLYVNTAPLTPIRTINIARARNIALEMIRRAYSSWEYFIMMDCDDVCAEPVDIAPLAGHLDNKEGSIQWDALSFNRKPYYDTWALSIYPYTFSKAHFKDGYLKWRHYIHKVMAAKADGVANDGLIQVYSAFNGFAIYRTRIFLKCHYDGTLRTDYIPDVLMRANIAAAGPIVTAAPDEPGDCEHRFFHYSAVLNHGARIRISPQCLWPR